MTHNYPISIVFLLWLGAGAEPGPLSPYEEGVAHVEQAFHDITEPLPRARFRIHFGKCPYDNPPLCKTFLKPDKPLLVKISEV